MEKQTKSKAPPPQIPGQLDVFGNETAEPLRKPRGRKFDSEAYAVREKVLKQLRRHAMPVHELAQWLDNTKRATITASLKSLAKDGIVTKQAEGAKWKKASVDTYHLTPKGERLAEFL